MRVTLYRTSGGWRWRIAARNGRIVGASTEAYRRRDGAEANLQMITGRYLQIAWGELVLRAGTDWPVRVIA